MARRVVRPAGRRQNECASKPKQQTERQQPKQDSVQTRAKDGNEHQSLMETILIGRLKGYWTRVEMSYSQRKRVFQKARCDPTPIATSNLATS